MQRYLHKFFFTAFIFIATTAVAQVKFTATVSAPQIGKDEMLQLRLAIENAQTVEKINPPAFANFTVLSGPSQETGMTNINGAVTRYVALSYILKPKRTGTLTIAAATAKADGKKLTCNTVTIKVTNTATGNSANSNPLQGFNPFDDIPVQQVPITDYVLKKGESAADKINRNMFVKLHTDKTNCYVGEPVVATYKLYTRLKSESNVVKNPSFSGFSVIDMQQPHNISSTREMLNGLEYNVYVIRKVQLYPLQVGSFELEPLQMENTVQFIKEAYAAKAGDMLNDVVREFAEAAIPAEGIETQKAILQNKAAVITVKALPADNVPAAFNGAVGKFTLKGALEKNIFTTDDAGKLIVMLEGEGNMQLVTAPDVKWPNGIEAFEPVSNEEIVKTTVPVSGRKLVSWDFTTALPGDYIIAPVVFCYFNPATGKYKIDSTGPIKFTVTKGTGKKAAPATVAAKKKSWLNNFFSNRIRVVTVVASLILIGLIFWLKRDKKKEATLKPEAVAVEEPTIILPPAPPKNYLEKAATLLGEDSTAFYTELNSALKDYLSDILKLPAATLTKKIIAEELDRKNVSTTTVIKLQDVMNDIELQLYTPFADREKMKELYDEAAATLQLLDAYKI